MKKDNPAVLVGQDLESSIMHLNRKLKNLKTFPILRRRHLNPSKAARKRAKQDAMLKRLMKKKNAESTNDPIRT